MTRTDAFQSLRRPAPTSLLLLLLLLPTLATLIPASALGQLSDRISEQRVRRANLIHTPWSYKKGKSLDALEHGSSWGAFGGVGAGMDSNIFESRRDEKGSTIADGLLQIENLRYLSLRDRLRFKAIATTRAHTESSRPDEYIGRAYVDWRHEFTDTFRFDLEGGFKLANDDIVNTEGFNSDRDFEHRQYEMQPSVQWRPRKDHQLEVRYRAKYRDYAETSGLPSLDFWLHGPSISYRIDPTRETRIELVYALRHETYGSNPARDSTGRILRTGRDEEHVFHRPRIEARWRPLPVFELTVAWEIERKEDLYDDFESYWSSFAWTRARWEALDGLTLSVTYAWEARDFDERRSEKGNRELRYQKHFVSPALSYRVNEIITLFAYYSLIDRDTNRVGNGKEFRDYRIHRWLSGISFSL